MNFVKTSTGLGTEGLLDLLKSGKNPEMSTAISDVREMDVRFSRVMTLTTSRVFVSCEDSGVLMNVGWVVNDKIAVCLSCQEPFNAWFRWKHHCRVSFPGPPSSYLPPVSLTNK